MVDVGVERASDGGGGGVHCNMKDWPNGAHPGATHSSPLLARETFPRKDSGTCSLN